MSGLIANCGGLLAVVLGIAVGFGVVWFLELRR